MIPLEEIWIKTILYQIQKKYLMMIMLWKQIIIFKLGKLYKILYSTNIYSQNEINDSAIDPFPLEKMDTNEYNSFQNGNITFHNGIPVPNRRLKSGNCECCSLM